MINRRLAGFIAAAALISSSTVASAAVTSAPIGPVNPWATLALTSSSASATAFCSAGVAGCVLPQIDTPAPPPAPSGNLPPPLPGAEAGVGASGISPLILVLGALAAAAAAYFLIHGSGGSSNSPV